MAGLVLNCNLHNAGYMTGSVTNAHVFQNRAKQNENLFFFLLHTIFEATLKFFTFFIVNFQKYNMDGQ